MRRWRKKPEEMTDAWCRRREGKFAKRMARVLGGRAANVKMSSWLGRTLRYGIIVRTPRSIYIAGVWVMVVSPRWDKFVIHDMDGYHTDVLTWKQAKDILKKVDREIILPVKLEAL